MKGVFKVFWILNVIFHVFNLIEEAYENWVKYNTWLPDHNYGTVLFYLGAVSLFIYILIDEYKETEEEK